MSGSRFIGRSIVAVALALACVQAGLAQDGKTRETPAGAATCKIYSLADLGGDPEMCKWIADTIPQVIRPVSWAKTHPWHTIKYHAPAKVLVVYHTPEVHTEIAAFLKDLKKTTQQAKAKETPLESRYYQPIMQAQFQPAGPPQTPPQAQQYQSSYPVPFPPTTPKHLFHFIIRYEGQGIIDENVVNFAKALTEESRAKAAAANSVLVAPPPPSTYSQTGGITGLPVPPGPGPLTAPPSDNGPVGTPVPNARPRMPLADPPLPSLPSTDAPPPPPPPPARSY